MQTSTRSKMMFQEFTVVRHNVMSLLALFFSLLPQEMRNIDHYYPTALRRVQITPKTSTNNTRYLYSRGPVRQVFLQRASDELDWSYEKKFLSVKTNFFSAFFLDRNLKVKNSLNWCVIWTIERRFFSRCEKWNKFLQCWPGRNRKNQFALFSCCWPIS